METRGSMETSLAIIKRLDLDTVMIQFKEEARISAVGIREIIQARRTHFGKDPYAVIAVVPESADFEMSMLNHDHHAYQPEQEVMRLLAVVGESPVYREFAILYQCYFPTIFSYRVCATLKEAKEWVSEMIEERATA